MTFRHVIWKARIVALLGGPLLYRFVIARIWCVLNRALFVQCLKCFCPTSLEAIQYPRILISGSGLDPSVMCHLLLSLWNNLVLLSEKFIPFSLAVSFRSSHLSFVRVFRSY